VTHGVIMLFMYIGAFRMKHHAQPALILALFYLLYFNSSLNIMRQYMALAIVFAFLADLDKPNPLYFLRYLLVVTILAEFHFITVISFAPAMIMLLLRVGKNRKPSASVRAIILCVMIIAATLAFKPLVQMVLDSGFFGNRYSHYFNHAGIGRLSKVRIGLLFLELLGLLLVWRKLREKNPHIFFYAVNFTAFTALQLLAPFVYEGRRLTLYFALANIVTVAMLPPCLEKKWQRAAAYTGIIALTVFYWYHSYVLGGAAETYPYILGEIF